MTHTLRIDGELTIYRAAELKPALLEALEAHTAIEVDLSEVSEFDTAGVQLLLAAKRAATSRGASLHLVNHSPAVLDVFELLDLSGHFGDPIVLAA